MTSTTPTSILLKKKTYGCTKPFVTRRDIEESNSLYYKYRKLFFQKANRSRSTNPRLPSISENALFKTTNTFFTEHKDDQHIKMFTESICNPISFQQKLVTQYKSSRNLQNKSSAKKLWSTMQNPSTSRLKLIEAGDKMQTINSIVHACTEFNSNSKINIKKTKQIEKKMKNIYSYIDNKVVSLLYKDELEKYCLNKYSNSSPNQLYWQLNVKKFKILQKKDVDLTKMLLPDELRRVKVRKVKFDPFETKIVHALGRGKHYRAASHHSSYKIFMDRVIEKAIQTTSS